MQCASGFSKVEIRLRRQQQHRRWRGGELGHGGLQGRWCPGVELGQVTGLREIGVRWKEARVGDDGALCTALCRGDEGD